jgi:hypothetical protein
MRPQATFVVDSGNVAAWIAARISLYGSYTD